jgi:hypothetical protein
MMKRWGRGLDSSRRRLISKQDQLWLPSNPEIWWLALIVSLGLLCDNRAQDMGGTNIYFKGR